jgi:hypothetical protein
VVSTQHVLVSKTEEVHRIDAVQADNFNQQSAMQPSGFAPMGPPVTMAGYNHLPQDPSIMYGQPMSSQDQSMMMMPPPNQPYGGDPGNHGAY